MRIFNFKSKLVNRTAIAKTLGFIFWLIGFISLPLFASDVSLMFRFAILFWYTTLWWTIWLFGLMNKHPAFPNWKFPFWFRWIFLWSWMNFVLVLLTYEQFNTMMQSAGFGGYSPFWIILEWAILWLIIEFFATKYWWEGEELIK